MLWLNCTPIGLQKIIEKLMICLPVTEYSLIMKAQEGAKPLLLAKLHVA